MFSYISSLFIQLDLKSTDFKAFIRDILQFTFALSLAMPF